SVVTLLVMSIGLAGGLVIKIAADDPWISKAPFDSLPVEGWQLSWANMLVSNWKVQQPHRLWLAALALSAFVSTAVVVVHRGRTGVTLACLAAIGAGSAAFLFMGTRLWIAMNQGDYRYSMPSLLLFQLAVFAPMLSPFRVRLGSPFVRRAVYLLAATLVFG